MTLYFVVNIKKRRPEASGLRMTSLLVKILKKERPKAFPVFTKIFATYYLLLTTYYLLHTSYSLSFLQRDLQHIRHIFHKMEGQIVANVIGDIIQIFFIQFRKDNGL